MWSIEKDVIIDCPIEEVYGFTSNPQNWHQWYVGMSEPKEMEGDGLAGTTVKFDLTLRGVPLPVTIEVVENKKSGLGYSWRGEVTGAIISHQNWTFTREGRRTKVWYAENYELPNSLLRKVKDRFIIRKVLNNSMEQTFKNLKAVCEAKKVSA